MARGTGRWSTQRARDWYDGMPWLIGCNYTPRTAINQLEMWQAETFSPRVIRQELAWASAIGMNTIRIFLHDLPWQADSRGFLKRIDQVLDIAHRQGVGAMVVFFDSVWHPFPQPGPQREPERGVHNSGWVQSPGVAVLREEKAFNRLKGYVTGIVKHFADDPRVQVWDVWNEPDNSNTMSYGLRDVGDQKPELAAKLLPRVFEWVRSAKPSQPVTSGVWAGDWATPQTLKPHEKVQIENSDVISFHCYGPPDDMETRIRQLQQYERPLLCTEFMSRGSGSTFQAVLPVLKKHHVAAYCWGLVNGRTQTIYPWDSWQRPYLKEPKPWFHDVFRADGSPYHRAEVRVIQSLADGKRA
jgi:hypothetical protein